MSVFRRLTNLARGYVKTLGKEREPADPDVEPRPAASAREPVEPAPEHEPVDPEPQPRVPPTPKKRRL